MSEDGQLQGVSRTGAQFIEINEHRKRRNNTGDGHRSHSGAKQDRIADKTIYAVIPVRQYLPGKVRAFLEFAVHHFGSGTPYWDS
ncbi:MAG: hypothetical protein MJE77_19095 [Proteobacteria bacterium]|nr:hypothetical protein [Pseudomonadota bacterium]